MSVINHSTRIALATVLAAGAVFIAGCASTSEPAKAPKAKTAAKAAKKAKPAALSDAEAAATYATLQADMLDRYNKSGDATAGVYTSWQSFNTVPYKSATHGQRYVNNYANSVAASVYGQFEKVTQMPVGSVLAKDSFKVNKKGKAVAGPLFLMEKMPAGFNADSRDWKYWAVMPNGKVMGVTGGENSKKVEFCAACHNGMGVKTDAMTFLPAKYRK